jgi:hypothetical protein
MSAWTSIPTYARNSVDTTLLVVDDRLNYMSPQRGKPSKRENALLAAVAVFSHGVWESFVEELAIELVTKLSNDIGPSRVPPQVQEFLQAGSAW